MNEDKELLELAAKAAGIEPLGKAFEMNGDFAGFCMPARKVWNPLTDDGDALRLAVKLGLLIDAIGISAGVRFSSENGYDVWLYEKHENHNNDPYAATRRAIVRAAAEIGRGME